jgi:fatty-acyl-CoA synthase
VAYVQLQEGAELTEEKILDHLKREMGERAAIPKEVFIINEIPLTPVGKIFKPALRWDAIRKVYRRELEALGSVADSVDVSVTEDKVHGSLAIITVKPASKVSAQEVKKRVDDILARYTVKYRLETI